MEGHADRLVQEGHRYLDQGVPSKAFQTWEKANLLYRKMGNDEGVMGTLVNQSIAQQMLGKNFNACWSLIIALDIEASICRDRPEEINKEELFLKLDKLPATPVVVAALQNLGIVSRNMSMLDQGEQLLEYAMRRSRKLDSSIVGDLKLSLANIHHANWSMIQDRYRLTSEPAIKSGLLKQSLAAGELTFSELQSLFDGPKKLSVNAKLNWLQFYQQLQGWIVVDGKQTELVALEQKVQPFVGDVVTELEIAQFDPEFFTPIEAIYGRLKIADNLLRLHKYQALPEGLETEPLTAAFQLAKKSHAEAKQIENSRAEALSLILIGKFYAYSGQDQHAQGAFRRAQNIGISTFASDAVYQSAWELAKLQRKHGNREDALKSYENAIAALEEVRGNLLSINHSLQQTFHEDVEPVYEEYLQMLVTSPEPDFEKALNVSRTLQVVTLENYLQCGKLAFEALEAQPNLPTVFNFLSLGDKVGVVVRHNGTLHSYTADRQIVELNAARLQRILQSTNLSQMDSEAFLPYAKVLYKALIEPGEHLIGADNRLIIVEDGVINGASVGLLHDGTSYLLEKYKISNSLGSQAVSQSGRATLKTLVAGVADTSPAARSLDLPSLPEVGQEELAISAALGDSRTSKLMDKSFTAENLQQKLPKYSILHIATHGKFSSNPAETYLLSWEDRLRVGEFDRLIRSGVTDSSSGLDLLFLSACETAKGDSRSQLGLAGLATQAGAKNAIASLWRVESESTSVLAGEFYRHVASGASYAEALQKAQLMLKNSEHYSHPYFWAPFLLLGSS
ncbi:hypothetical protein C1752_10561 [Acaryochloris thomasi RCC1774]|uniref:CHAT domain-containing protein n=2 Tax=Acaryochloris TaxID=155977 RepID=A0A2W1JJW9_9CYAN|nr:hypothetical protein C1752_10561 [Acaryochloris thomasi RCC1774]